MQKSILIESLSTPEQDGFRDKLVVIENNVTTFHCQCSTCPNSFRPVDKVKWDIAYAWICPTTLDKPYTWQCVLDKKRGKILTVNNRGNVPTRNKGTTPPDYFAVGVLVHKGYSETWRGSMACVTIQPMIWDAFIARFTIGEKGILNISDYLKKSIAPVSATATAPITTSLNKGDSKCPTQKT